MYAHTHTHTRNTLTHAEHKKSNMPLQKTFERTLCVHADANLYFLTASATNAAQFDLGSSSAAVLLIGLIQV